MKLHRAKRLSADCNSTSLAASMLAVSITFSTVAHAGPHRQLDLRNQTDASGEYSVSLCARPSPDTLLSLPGHAFVAYSFLPAGSGSARRFLAVGFTTDSAIKGTLSFSKVLAQPTGYLEEEHFTHVKEECLVLLVSKADFDRAIAKVTPYASVPAFKDLKYVATYSLTQNDCVTFMSSVAEVFVPRGIKLPARTATEFPTTYLRRIILSN
jgi:hypothetical protein